MYLAVADLGGFGGGFGNPPPPGCPKKFFFCFKNTKKRDLNVVYSH